MESIIHKKSYNLLIQYSILFIISVTPLIAIVGNIAPQISGIKINWITNGLVLILILIGLLINIKKWYGKAIVLFSFLFLNFAFALKYNFVEAINTLSGPFLFIYILITFETKLLNRQILVRFIYIFLVCSFVPIAIAILQFVGIMPLTIWAFDYVNMTKIGGVRIPRVNGFLYHPSELSTIGYFLFCIISILARRQLLILTFPFFLFFQLLLLIKSCIGGFFILGMYFFSAPIKLTKHLKYLIASSGAISAILIFVIWGNPIVSTLQETVLSNNDNMIFNPHILTGRGRMWSILLLGVFYFFKLPHYIIGGGFGSNKFLFDLAQSKTKINWVADFTPHPHNEFLYLFLIGGVVLLFLYLLIFHWAASILRTFNKTPYRIHYILIIAFFTSGMTVPISDRFSFWIALSYLFIAFFVKSTKVPKLV